MLEHFSSHVSGWIFNSLCDTYMHRDENKMHNLVFPRISVKISEPRELKCHLLLNQSYLTG